MMSNQRDVVAQGEGPDTLGNAIQADIGRPELATVAMLSDKISTVLPTTMERKEMSAKYTANNSR